MINPRTVFRALGRNVLDTVLPPRCVVSGDIVSDQGMLAPHVWRDIAFISAPMCDRCGMPFDYHIEDKTLCARCTDYPPPYQSARSAVTYSDAARDMILGFKHGDRTHALSVFTPWLLRAGGGILPHVDLIVPVPLHYWRLIARRYNQAALLAQDLGCHAGVPVCVDALRRRRNTKSQGHLSPQDRAHNVSGAFEITPKRAALLQGKRIALIDDVYTTGATVRECTKILLENGVSSVHILTIAKVKMSET